MEHPYLVYNCIIFRVINIVGMEMWNLGKKTENEEFRTKKTLNFEKNKASFIREQK